MRFTLQINGARHAVDVDPRTPLLWVLRDVLGMTGTKYGCGIEVCGACTVLMNGEAEKSCHIEVSEAAQKKVTTIEGLRAIAHGLSAALWGHVEFTNRRASVRNFSGYRLLKLREMPHVSVRIIESGMDHLGGIGEVSVPPIAPAVANAWFTLTGERVRTLPFFPGQSRMGEG